MALLEKVRPTPPREPTEAPVAEPAESSEKTDAPLGVAAAEGTAAADSGA